MRIFLAGGTGVIGRRVVPALVAAGHDVTAVGRTPEKRSALEQGGASAIDVDLFDKEALQAAVAGHDVVVNVATAIPPAAKAIRPAAWRLNDRIRREASANLVDAALAAGASRYIQESFAPMYAGAGEEWIDEGSPLDPAPHSRSTLDAEASAGRFTQSGGGGVVLRFGFFYGPDGSFAEDTIRAVRRGLAPTVGRATDYIASIHHDDTGSAVVAALNVPPGVYNVVDDEPLRRRDFYNALADALNVAHPRMPPKWLAGLTGSLGKTLGRSIRVSNRRFRAASGWAPRYPNAREGWRAVAAALDG
jgi:nucleoside-diphosphate-sugar epimerase